MAETKRRIAWIDMAKGYGILAVILGHINGGLLKTWIYTFHMPLFFLLSGYVFNIKEDFPVFLKKKCKSMLIPYVCLGIPMLAFQCMLNWHRGKISKKWVLRLLMKFVIQRRTWTLWFLTCLFFLNIFFYITLKILKTNGKIFIFTIVMTITGLLYYKLGGLPLPWNIDVCLTAYPFFFLGYFYKEKHEMIDKYLGGKNISIILFIVLGIINILCGYLTIIISGSGLEMYASRYGFAPLTYLSAFSGIICVIIVSKWFTIRPIQYIGKNSLLYYAWHQTIMIPISKKCLSLIHITINGANNLNNVIFYKLMQLVVIISIITICNIIISQTRLRFMLGK